MQDIPKKHANATESMNFMSDLNMMNKNEFTRLTKIRRGQLVLVQPSTDISTAAKTHNTGQ